jgi:ATP-binding cassette subfamily B protein
MQLLLQLFIPSLLAFVIAFVLFGSLHPLFAVILGVWVLLHMGVAFLFAKSGNMASKVHSESRSLVIGQIVDSFTNYLNVMLFSRKRFETRYVAKFQEKEVELHTKALRIIAKARLLQGFLCALLPGLFLTWFMLHMWMIDAITVSDVVYIFYGSWNIVILAWISGIELPNFFKECGVCSQALSVIIPEHEVVDVKGAKALKVKNGRLAFKDVTFNYSEKKPLFKKINLEVEPGQKVGLVGVSGGGKTTFVNLILRLFDVKGGVIEIDGQPIDSVTLKSLREKIALIPQEPTLFHRTLVENIRYGKIDASDKKVKEAAKRAHCEEFINKLEDGYQTYVGERGVKLSGGQRQRIAIARAILKDAPILILDEATSALDSVTEKEIQDSLDYLMKGRTVLVIAHRLSTLKGMDRIVVFDKGKIVEDGTHNSLLKKGKHYAKLWKMQSHGFLMDEEK